MKKLFAMLVLLILVLSSAIAEEPFTVDGSLNETAAVGMLIVDDDFESEDVFDLLEKQIPITFTRDAKNVEIRHSSGLSIFADNVKAGDFFVVLCEIPEGMPNLSVSYSLPEDEKEVVYTRMISKSGVDGSYIAVSDWYTSMAWTVAERLLSIASDDAYLYAYTTAGDVRGVIDAFVLPESMPENHYFVSTSRLNEVVETYLLEEEILMEEENLKYYLRGLPQIIKNMVVAREGALSLAASSILQAGECMILPDIPFEPGFIVFDAGEENTIIVSMSLAGEGIASFNASIVSREALNMLTDMEALIEEMM